MPRVKYVAAPLPADWPILQQQMLWPEQVDYELIRPSLLEGIAPKQRANQTGVPVRTIQRKLREFRQLGMFAFLSAEAASQRPNLSPHQAASPGPKPNSRRGQPVSPEVIDYLCQLKAEYPPFRVGELVEICRHRFGYRLSPHTVAHLLSQNPTLTLMATRRYATYAQLGEGTERRRAIVTLYAEGWNAKTIAGYLQVHRSTVYEILNRFLVEGVLGLADKSHARHDGVRKVDVQTIELVRQLHTNPELGEFRIHAALLDLGIELSPRTCGYLLARLRQLEEEAAGSGKAPKEEPKPFPYYAERAHQYWTVDLRYIETHKLGGGPFYVISILDNYSRAILASAISRSQDLASFLIVLYAALKNYGAPENLISDRGSIFLANQAKVLYQKLGISKIEYERRQPWQSLIETNFNLQRRLADADWAKVSTWPQAQAVHEQWQSKHNQQSHWGHRKRADKKRSPLSVLGESKGRPFEAAELARLFASTSVVRKIDRRGYVKLRHWRVYAEINLAGLPGYQHITRIWLHEQDLRVEYEGKSLGQYQVSYEPDQKTFKEIKVIQLYDNQLPALQPLLIPAAWIEWKRVFDCRRPKASSGVTHRPLAAEQLILPSLARV